MAENLIIFNIKTDANDDVLGITTPWINSFAKKFKRVYVISTSIGILELEENVQVFSLGGEKNTSKIYKFFILYLILTRLLYKIGRNTVVFFHMTPLYLVLSSPLLKILKIKSVLWYAHKKISFILKFASLLSDCITTIDSNSFKLHTRTKIYHLGHGITFPSVYNKIKKPGRIYELSIVGRISEIKRIHFLIEAVSELNRINNIDINLNIYGDTITKKDKLYKNHLINLITKNYLTRKIILHGSIPHKKIGEIINNTDLAFNLSIDCGLDKAGIEALAIGIPLIYTNPSYNKIFKDLNIDYSNYYIDNLSTDVLVNKILYLLSLNINNSRLQDSLVNYIRSEYSVDSLINKIYLILKKN
jgi:glycosyltransferase involved in cell wall biosynthesis